MLLTSTKMMIVVSMHLVKSLTALELDRTLRKVLLHKHKSYNTSYNKIFYFRLKNTG